MKIHLSKGKPLFIFSRIEFDKQDLLILFALLIVVLALALITHFIGLNGVYALIPGLLVASIVFRNILIAKGKIKK